MILIFSFLLPFGLELRLAEAFLIGMSALNSSRLFVALFYSLVCPQQKAGLGDDAVLSSLMGRR